MEYLCFRPSPLNLVHWDCLTHLPSHDQTCLHGRHERYLTKIALLMTSNYLNLGLLSNEKLWLS